MHIIATTHGYILTDGLSFVQTFLVNSYDTRQACLFAAISTAFTKETIWNQHLHRGRIVKKAGIIHEGRIRRPHKIEV